MWICRRKSQLRRDPRSMFTKDDEEVKTGTTGEADSPQGVVEWISEFDSGRSADISIVWEVTALVSLNLGSL